MGTLTYQALATTTLGSANNSITFSSISSSYTDLRLVLVGTVIATGSVSSIRYNGDSSTIYNYSGMSGTGSAATGKYSINDRIFLSGLNSSDDSTTIPCLMTVDVFSYTNATYKNCLATTSWDKNGSGVTYRIIGLWKSTAAINSFTFYNSNGWNSGTIATLYGILKV